MSKERLSYLLKQYLDNNISSVEYEELMIQVNDESASQEVQAVLEELISQASPGDNYNEADWEPLIQRIVEPRRPVKFRWMIAAAILLALVGAGYLFCVKRTVGQQENVVVAHDLAPGSNRAILTLGDGSKIDLDAAHNGIVAQQGGAQLIKNRNEQLIYRQGSAVEVQYNRLTTPRGGQFQLQLPDGSKVWLNAATTLRYPTRFTGDERTVELKGEAYFEISQDAKRPFRVKVLKGAADTDLLEVEVLGTHFNIMDYEEEPAIRTTLLEGSVRVRKGAHSVVIRPGQQASLSSGEELAVAAADMEEAVAWKDGMFMFRNAGIGEVMRQLARWYDVEVVYKDGVPKDRYQGEMYRNVNASKILKVLEGSGLHFTVEGKKIILFMDKAP
jgi:transmembrane sensor